MYNGSFRDINVSRENQKWIAARGCLPDERKRSEERGTKRNEKNDTGCSTVNSTLSLSYPSRFLSPSLFLPTVRFISIFSPTRSRLPPSFRISLCTSSPSFWSKTTPSPSPPSPFVVPSLSPLFTVSLYHCRRRRARSPRITRAM